jgi:predicted transposase YbfD/YdcC
MGCQRDIAEKIIKKEANYILAVKQNQEELLEQIKDEFLFSKTTTTDITIEGDHGRIETRKCIVISEFVEMTEDEKWKNLTKVIKIESKREFKNSYKKTEESTRYYISSLKSDAAFFQKSIRSHWAIENKLHWTLDVAFGEDASRKRAGNADQNYSILLKVALNLIKNKKSVKQSVKTKRLRAGWDNDYLLKVLEVKV